MTHTQASYIPGVRVADAPLLSAPRADRARNRDVGSAGPETDLAAVPAALYQILVALALVFFTRYLSIPELPLVSSLLVDARYMLWPFILVLFVISLVRNGTVLTARPLAPFSVYFFIGVMSALLGVAVIDGFKELVFWLLGVLASVSAGLWLKPETMIRTTFFVFSFMIVSSLVCILVFPNLGIVADLRSSSGQDWRGLFPGKNSFGEICVYGLLFTLVLSDLWVLRVAMFGAAWFALVKTNSQGSVVLAIAQMAYLLCIPKLARLAQPVWTKSMIVLGTLGGAAVTFVFGTAPIMALLGRDPTLSGRTDIWVFWLKRAMQSPWLGTGPGTFTTPGSSVTADLTQAFSGDGAINTPHNMYIAVFGEVGILGLVAFVIPLIYMFVVLPFSRRGRLPLICGLVAFTMAIGGLGETHEVFGLGLNMCLLILVYAATLRPVEPITPPSEGSPGSEKPLVQ